MGTIYRNGKPYGTSITGVGVEKIEQTVTTEGSGEANEITVTTTDGKEYLFEVRNGKQGDIGLTALQVTKIADFALSEGTSAALPLDYFNRVPAMREETNEAGETTLVSDDYFSMVFRASESTSAICWCRVIGLITGDDGEVKNVQFEVLQVSPLAGASINDGETNTGSVWSSSKVSDTLKLTEDVPLTSLIGLVTNDFTAPTSGTEDVPYINAYSVKNGICSVCLDLTVTGSTAVYRINNNPLPLPAVAQYINVMPYGVDISKFPTLHSGLILVGSDGVFILYNLGTGQRYICSFSYPIM